MVPFSNGPSLPSALAGLFVAGDGELGIDPLDALASLDEDGGPLAPQQLAVAHAGSGTTQQATSGSSGTLNTSSGQDWPGMTFASQPTGRPAGKASSARRAASASASAGVRGAAQRRHRQRQKDNLAQLNAQLADRMAQVQQLTQDNRHLKLKTEVLEKVVDVCDQQISIIQRHMSHVHLGSSSGSGQGQGQQGEEQQQQAAASEERQAQRRRQALEQQLLLPPDEGANHSLDAMPEPDLPPDFSHVEVCARWAAQGRWARRCTRQPHPAAAPGCRCHTPPATQPLQARAWLLALV